MKSPTKQTCSVFAACAAVAAVIGCGGGGGSSPSGTATASSTGSIYTDNVIVYGVPDSSGATFSVNEVNPNSTGNTPLLSGISSEIQLFVEVPGVKNQFVIAADLTGSGTGIYLSTGLALTNLKTLVAPNYADNPASLSISANGKTIVFAAELLKDLTGNSYLFSVPIGGGTPTQYGLCDGAAISPADSNTVAYVGFPSATASFDQVFTRQLSAGSGGKVTQITTDQVQHTLPAFNRLGTQIAYVEQGSTSSTTMIDTLATGATITLPNPNLLTPQSESFNGDGTQVAIAYEDSTQTGQLATQLIDGTSNPVTILTSSVPMGNYGLYWTDANGRGISGSFIPAATRRAKRLLAYLRHSH